MVFENRILPRVSCSADEMCIDDFCRYNDIHIIGKSISGLDQRDIEACHHLISEYMRYNDFLAYISTASNRKEIYLKYILTPPYTTSKMDCEHVLNLLLLLHVVSDYSFSTKSQSYFIEMDQETSLTIREVLSIGLCSILAANSISIQSLRYNTRITLGRQEDMADVVVLQGKKLWLINIENAIGLEADVPSHQKQFERVKKRVFRSRKTYCNIEDVVIVTPFVASLLPGSPNIVAIDKYNSLISLLAKEK